MATMSDEIIDGDMDNSFDQGSVDVNEVIAEFDGDEGVKIPVKKLSGAFESCLPAQPPAEDSSMRVFLRVRPMSSSDESTITIRSENTIVTNAPESSRRAQYTKTEERHYMFSRVFGPECSQNEVYDRTTSQLLRRFFSGENCVLFAYGMTNAGKTYTVQGTHGEPGILPRAVSAIFYEIGQSKKHDLSISMLEIYQDNIYDLLSKKKREKLSIRDANGKVEVNKLSLHRINSAKEACKLMDVAAAKRSKASTFLNTGSSRSHAVYTLTLTTYEDETAAAVKSSAAFQLVDLAGAERSNRTKATSSQQKEANNINTSLMQLWRCLQGMRKRGNELSSSQEIIPFRESKLTHLLMPILNRAGMAGIAMVACVNPQVDDYDETLSILGNASLASKIKEISDVGRTLAQHQMASALNGGHSAPSAAAAAGIAEQQGESSAIATASAAAAAAMGGKRRRVDGNNGTSRLMQPTAASAANAFAGNVAKKLHPNTKTVAVHAEHGALAVAGAKRKHTHKDSAGSYTSLHTEGSSATAQLSSTGASFNSTTGTTATAADEDADAGGESERKRMRIEIVALQEQNQQLQQAQITRETEIRAEVCEEMAVRSHHLLEQIQQLQEQLALAQASSSTLGTVSKSARKANKRRLLEEAQENAERDLQEAEDELVRSKTRHEKEIAVLRVENANLRAELQRLMVAQEEQQKQQQQQQLVGEPHAAGDAAESSAKTTKSVRIHTDQAEPPHQPHADATAAVAASTAPSFTASGGSHTSAAKEFSKRFRKNDENSAANAVVVGKSPAVLPRGRSPNRSPLSEVSKSNIENSPKHHARSKSPLQKAQLGAGFAGPTASSICRSQSPSRADDRENQQQLRSYGTRLRSQAMRI